MLHKNVLALIFEQPQIKGRGYYLDGDELRQRAKDGEEKIIANLDKMEIINIYVDEDDPNVCVVATQSESHKLYIEASGKIKATEIPPPAILKCAICKQKKKYFYFCDHDLISFHVPVCYDCRREMALEFISGFTNPRMAIHAFCWIEDISYIGSVVANITAKEKDIRTVAMTYTKKMNLKQYAKKCNFRNSGLKSQSWEHDCTPGEFFKHFAESAIDTSGSLAGAFDTLTWEDFDNEVTIKHDEQFREWAYNFIENAKLNND
ncbi:MAG: hypothetical protein FWE04_01680 [Oscillospiraceae bacterium]|nr:hypothetical protein [Oscillospiraceae bacterium]